MRVIIIIIIIIRATLFITGYELSVNPIGKGGTQGEMHQHSFLAEGGGGGGVSRRGGVFLHPSSEQQQTLKGPCSKQTEGYSRSLPRGHIQ